MQEWNALKGALRIVADVTNDQKKIVAETIKKYGKLDIVICAHGTNMRKPLHQYSKEDWDRIISVNLSSIFGLMNAALPEMREGDRFIVISSTQGLVCWNGKGRFSLAPYCASKAGLIALTKAAALDVAKRGITVNAVCPAFVDTPLVRPLKEDKELYADILARPPMGRFAKPEEVVGPCLFLASEAASYITGHALLVDGGWTIRSEEHTSELQSQFHLVCRLLLEKKT